ncbi:MAG TPA: BamA/TamA family outer membrane protein [Polyangiaceae bacterium]|nr:BamA/TamA family outer membrane protein [Polyangiaceae bacterium]
MKSGWRLFLYALGQALLAGGLAAPAYAADPPPTATGRAAAPLGEYERRVLDVELAKRRAEIDDAPEGKLISEVEIVTLEVFDESDPFPDFFNVFHVVSRERVIRRELLLHRGDPYRRRRADESVRNLRSLPQLSLVVLVALKDPDPRRVRLLLIAKDIWSLRLNWNAQLGPGGLTYLILNPSERNFLGTHLLVGGTFELFRSRYGVSGTLAHGRLFGTRLRSAAQVGAYVNRASGSTEGSFGQFSFGLPKYSEAQRWSYGVSLQWDDGITRVNVALPHEPYPTSTSLPYDSGGVRLFSYRREAYYEVLQTTRSFGLRHKLDLTFGLEASRRVYRSLVPDSIDPVQRQKFIDREIPIGDTRFAPFFQVSRYENDFLKTIEIEALGLQEEFRLGPQAMLRAYVAGTEFGSTRDIAGLFSGLAYTTPLGNGLMRAVGTSVIEYANDGKHQGMLALAARIASPRFPLGRLHFDAVLENRYQNYLRDRSFLGGDGRLRGYAASDTEVSGSLRGSDLVAMNLEFRSRGINVLSFQCGLAAFYDAGGTASRFDALAVKHSAGVGLRVLFPTFDRTVFRADWAFPLNPGYDHFPGALFFTAGQAFGVPKLGDCLSCVGELRPVTYGLSSASW